MNAPPNDPMNPMSRVQTASPTDPMGQVRSTNPRNPMGLGIAQDKAYGLASLGRGNDSMLVHMTPREVASLQDMAMAHGGSLTTNPDTGLPEAGFLDSILPVIVGIGAAAAAPFTGGLSLGALGTVGSLLANPLIVGGLSGLGAMLANGGDWREGLKWGLGTASGVGAGQGLASMVKPVATVGQAGAATGAAGTASAKSLDAANAALPVNAAGEVTSLSNIPKVTTISDGFATGAPAVGNYPTTLSNMGTGLKNAVTSPGAYKAFDPRLGSLIGTGGRGMAGTAGLGLASMSMQRPDALKVGKTEQDKNYGPGGKYEYKGPYTYPEPTVTYATPEEIERGVEHNYFGENYNRPPQYVAARKEGGPIGMAQGGSTGEQMYFPESHFNTGTTTGASNTPANLQAAGNAVRGFFSGQGRPGVTASPQTPPWQQINASGQVQNTRAPTQAEMNFANSARRPYYGFAMGNGGGYADNWAIANQLASQNQPKAPTSTAPVSTSMGNGGYSEMGEQMFFTPSYFSAGMSQGYAEGGIASLPGATTEGGMVEGLLDGPGDGMSDSIPASIDGKQEARLATGEFVIPADVVSHLGNGATEPGAKVLYAMMDRIRNARTGNPKQGKEINADKFLPA